MKALKFLIILALIAGGSWYAWGKFHKPKVTAEAAQGGPGGMPMGPVPVPVATLQTQPVQQWLQFPSRLVAVDTVDIRPRVGGAIQKIYFQPGEIVEKDAPLFLIDPRPYEAELSRAQAALAGAQAQNTLSNTDLSRAQRLIAENAISKRDVDTRQNANRLAGAALKGAQATVEQAQLNLSYATIKAPVRGRISRAEITLGNLVNAANAPVLATIVSVDSIYADFEVDEQTYITMVRQQNGGGNEAALPIELVLNSDDRANGQPAMSYKGKIVSFDNKLDTASGTIRARAIFENKDKALVPGMFANVRLGQAEAMSGILIPDRVINTDQDKKYVYVVANGKVTYRPVTLGGLANGMRIITGGLQAGDQIITDGLQKIRPDMPVTPQETPLAVSVDAQKPASPATAEKPAEPKAEQPQAHNTDASGMTPPKADIEALEPVAADTKADNATAVAAPPGPVNNSDKAAAAPAQQ